RWTKTAGSASDKFQDTPIFNETLRIANIQRVQGGRYYCKAENGVGVAAIKSIRVDVQSTILDSARGKHNLIIDTPRDLDKPVLTVHQTISDVRGNYYQEKTVFLRCTVNSNPPARFIWKRGNTPIEQSKDNGVDIYEPLYTQGETKVLKLKNLRPQDFANYTCQVSVRNVCDIPDSSVTFRLTNATKRGIFDHSSLHILSKSSSDLGPLLCTLLFSSPHRFSMGLSLEAPPALKLSVNETYVVDPGQDVTLTCDVTAGFPTPTVTWSRYPDPLPRRSVVRGGSLTLRSVTSAESGFYNCTAVNNVGNPARRNVNLIVRSMKNLTFQITPDSNKDGESIQMGRDLKLSCHVDAQPQDKVNYTWYKNGAPIYPSDSLIVLRSDPDMPPGTSSLEIVDMKFRDQATYSCVANFPGSSVPELRVDVNITQSSVVPPVLSVPVGGSMVNVSEGGTAELVCLVDGKPRPPVLWSRANKDLPMPSGDWVVETRDGRLRLTNVTRDMMGAYRCQTAPYNGLNIKRRVAQVQLNVEYPPVVDPVFQDVRSPSSQNVILRCVVVKSNPNRIASARWYRNSIPIRTPPVDAQDVPQLRFKLDLTNNGTYECKVSNGVGTSTCTFVVSAKPYSAEFYFDTPNPIRIKGSNYSYNLQWTQKEPTAVDKVIGYWINVQQMCVSVGVYRCVCVGVCVCACVYRCVGMVQSHTSQPPVPPVPRSLFPRISKANREPGGDFDGTVEKGDKGGGVERKGVGQCKGQKVLSKQINPRDPGRGLLMSYVIMDLRIPLSYEVGLTPITSLAAGDTVTRTIEYSEPYTSPRPSDHVCGFEDVRICGFSQDRSEVFDWTRQNHLSQNPKRSVNTGPDMDRSGTKEGYYMYIETSRPREKGDRARLLSPLYNVTPARGPSGSGRVPHCISFFYHMKGKHIGTLNVLLRVKSIATVDSVVWSRSGHQGPNWLKASVMVYPSGPFQVCAYGVIVVIIFFWPCVPALPGTKRSM
ncbi:hypothetical protein NFI96_024488, partial [Prochilodus magdalenae]